VGSADEELGMGEEFPSPLSATKEEEGSGVKAASLLLSRLSKGNSEGRGRTFSPLSLSLSSCSSPAPLLSPTPPDPSALPSLSDCGLSCLGAFTTFFPLGGSALRSVLTFIFIGPCPSLRPS
jgi:hypothetical protein